MMKNLIQDNQINLDDFTDDPAEMIGLAFVLESYGTYCRLRAYASILRKTGEVSTANKIQEDMDRLYARLPEWARW